MRGKSRTLGRAEAAISQHQQSLSLIAHEIRSPVATLLLNDQLDGPSRRLVERMQCAMDLLKENAKSTPLGKPFVLPPEWDRKLKVG